LCKSLPIHRFRYEHRDAHVWHHSCIKEGRKKGIPMDINRFTEKAQQALQAAQSSAVRRGHQQIDVEHLLLSLLEQEPGLAVSIVRKADVDVNTLRQRAERELDKVPRVSTVSGNESAPHVSGRLNRLLTKAEDEAKQFKDDFISVEHLLLAMTDDTGA